LALCHFINRQGAPIFIFIFSNFEHTRLHGLGKKVCFKRVALPSEFTRHVGNQAYLRGIYGLTVDGIVENTIALLKIGTSKMQVKN